MQASVTVQENIPFKFGKVPITVDISYTSGGAASGQATVAISRNGPDILQKTVQITSGTATFELDIVNDLKVTAGQYGYFRATVIFGDALSGDKVTSSADFRILPKTYRFRSTTEGLGKPGAPLKFTIIMERYDGTPAPAGTQLTIEANSGTNIPSQTLTIGDDGTVTSSVDLPSDLGYFYMKIKSEDAEDGNLSARMISSVTRRGRFLQIDVLTSE